MSTFPVRHNGGPPIADDSGWVAISRASRTHPVVGWHLFVQPADAGRGALQPALAWQDLIMECRYADGTVNNNGRVMLLRRGQMLGATAWLANRWNWSIKTVRGFLERLETHGMIRRFEGEHAPQCDENGTKNDVQLGRLPDLNGNQLGRSEGRSKGRLSNTLSICNYDDYQMPVRRQGPVAGHVERQVEGRLPAEKGPVEGRLPENAYRERARNNKGTIDNKETIEQIPPSPPMGGDVDQQPSLSLHSANTPKSRKTNATGPDIIAGDFEIWWAAFPNSVRKVGKGECLALFRQAITGKRATYKKGAQKILDHGLATARQLIDGVHAYAATQPDPNYVPAPATWLNQGRWLDAPKPIDVVSGPNGTPATKRPKPYWFKGREEVARSMPHDRWIYAVKTFANGIWPEDILGPPPGYDGCLVPGDVILELELMTKYGPHKIRGTTGFANHN